MITRFGLLGAARFATEIRKSKFVANAINVASAGAARNFIEQIADSTATHNCWAWRVGQNYRFNDDGEPSGSAGKPILAAIDGQACDNIALVVTRWFGGIKLGAGGLMRAYGGCAAECLRMAEKSELVDCTRVEIVVAFGVLPTLRVRMQLLDAVIIAQAFSDTCAVVQIELPTAHLSLLQNMLDDLTRGQCKMRRVQR